MHTKLLRHVSAVVESYVTAKLEHQQKKVLGGMEGQLSIPDASHAFWLGGKPDA